MADETVVRDGVRVGAFVKVIEGEFKGAFGSLLKIEQDGFALIRNRDHRSGHPELVSVPVSQVDATSHTGGRS